ncbi:early endosome antigen 1-like [Ambystoma mexicanum]|uniref:early endosome antigen 1-like n=1 Tax=Ambystoma mexicanum TaxID=8296 RepID=UPI0037E953C5
MPGVEESGESLTTEELPAHQTRLRRKKMSEKQTKATKENNKRVVEYDSTASEEASKSPSIKETVPIINTQGNISEVKQIPASNKRVAEINSEKNTSTQNTPSDATPSITHQHQDKEDEVENTDVGRENLLQTQWRIEQMSESEQNLISVRETEEEANKNENITVPVHGNENGAATVEPLSQKEKAIKAKEKWKQYYQRATKSEHHWKETVPLSPRRLEWLSLDLSEIEALMQLQQTNKKNKRLGNESGPRKENSAREIETHHNSDIGDTKAKKTTRPNVGSYDKGKAFRMEESICPCTINPNQQQESVATTIVDLQNMLIAVTSQTMTPYVKLQEVNIETIKEHSKILNSIFDKQKSLQQLIYRIQERLSVQAENSYFWQQRLAEIARQDRIDKASQTEALITITKTSLTNINLREQTQKKNELHKDILKKQKVNLRDSNNQSKKDKTQQDNMIPEANTLLVDPTSDTTQKKTNGKYPNQNSEPTETKLNPNKKKLKGGQNYSIFQQQVQNVSDKATTEGTKKQTKKQQRL